MSGRAINWYLQRITGAALLVLLIMHFWVEHFTAEVRTPAGLTFEVIQRRFFQNPWFVAVDITFLFIALYHGLNGIRNICLDYTWGVRFRTPITVSLVLLGIVVAYWGVTAFTGNQHLKQMTNSRTTNDEIRTSSHIRHSSFVIRHS
jgi:succinate dehydrogenase / fumarate reductase membrane anchor subunit